jgi:hypothetical protein
MRSATTSRRAYCCAFFAFLFTGAMLFLSFQARAAERPLSQSDVQLLLMGGASTDKLVGLISQRGVDFRMTPDLAKKFHDDGASDDVIDALTRAGQRASAAPAPQAASPAQTAPPASPAPPPAPQAAAGNQPSTSTADQKVAAEPVPAAAPASAANSNSESAKTTSASPDPKPAGVDLGDPSPARVQQIIQEFAAKEKVFKEARDNYTYHQINKVQTLDADRSVTGQFLQEWDILYDDAGRRIEKVTYAPLETLSNAGLLITREDLDAMRNIQPFVLTSDDLPDYEIKYLGHVRVDQITAYVFRVRPKEIKKGRQYFDGEVWVDDRDLQIVKSEGKNVPELRTKKGENLFPRFTTYREQIDGKFWFPTFTMADDTLYFGTGPIHVKEVIKYTDYKQFKAKSTIKVIGGLAPGSSEPQASAQPQH